MSPFFIAFKFPDSPFNGSPTAICGLPQGFGELLFVARDFCQPLCPSVASLLSSGCNNVMAYNTVIYPYNFSTSCAPQEVVCGVPVPQCSGTSNVGYLPHVDLVIPQDYNDNFVIDVYLLKVPGALFPTGVYELRSQIAHVIVDPCATVALNGNVPFAVTAVCDTIGSPSAVIDPEITRFTLRPDTTQATTLTGGAWARITLDFSSEPSGVSGCRPLVSSMVFRYARKALDDAFALFPGS